MRMPLHWTALLLGVSAAVPVVAEAALRLYASYVTKRDHCSDPMRKRVGAMRLSS
jgi:hypothetical protein